MCLEERAPDPSRRSKAIVGGVVFATGVLLPLGLIACIPNSDLTIRTAPAVAPSGDGAMLGVTARF